MVVIYDKGQRETLHDCTPIDYGGGQRDNESVP